MIRVVDSENREPKALSKGEKAVFKLLGIVVADNPSEIKRLLLKYGVTISQNATNLQLIDSVVNSLEVQDKNFNQDLSEIFSEQVIPDDYDSFNHNDLFTNEDEGYDNFFKAFEGIKAQFKKLGQWLKGNKKAKAQAKSESVKSAIQFQTKKDLKERQEQTKEKKAKIIKVIATITVLSIATGLIIWKVKKGQKGKNIYQPK